MKLNFDDIKYKLKIVGDLHGALTQFASNIKDINTIYILVGDNNIGKTSFKNDIETLMLLEFQLAKNNNYLLIIRGNHDNPKYFKKKSSFKNELSDNAPHIILLPDYSIVHINDYTILCIGGARSADRVHRIKDYNYWASEMVKKPDDNFYESLEKDKERIDIVVSHTAPLFAPPVEFSNGNKGNSYFLNSWALYDKELKLDVYKERLLLKGIYDKLSNKNQIKYWFYGHFHKSSFLIYNKTKLIGLTIKEIKTVKI